MRIALLLKQNNEEKSIDTSEKAVVFTVEGDKVVGVENETVPSKKVAQLSFWARTKKINEIYIPEVNEGFKWFFDQLGIILRGYDEIPESKLLRNYIV